ncbi:sensor histidine kinase [Chitinophaga nivalis]|uniref:Histidine kinase n=1 Tax=Chitinophaga nivalis TaxID=2991709 RepID=A0ABT3IL65_9BACT|nr:histidine kinase [Chitinophaga nivalis]MCW3465597.1 histidine kinase [Chitinophaga nivalis]MCW3484712.1 histidine kinase [Chitinophaga nivalis]
MSIVDIIVIGSTVMLTLGILVVVLVIFQQKQVILHKLTLRDIDLKIQRERLLAVLQGQEQERKRIAEDLHDEVGAQLSVLKLNIGGLQPLLKTGSGEAERLRETKDFADIIIQQLRFISQSLHPQALENLGLAHALDSFCNLMNKNKQVKISFKTADNGQPVDREKALNVYRVVQELINNILKHAQATAVLITYQSTPTLLTVNIEDDGNGALLGTLGESRAKTGSLGLKNIESRLNIIGGTINFANRTPHGTIATISVENYQSPTQNS